MTKYRPTHVQRAVFAGNRELLSFFGRIGGKAQKIARDRHTSIEEALRAQKAETTLQEYLHDWFGANYHLCPVDGYD